MRVVCIPAVLVLATLAVPVASAQEAAYHYVVEDAEFDEAESCVPWWDLDTNGACDLLTFEAGNDAENLYLRFTMGAVSPNPQAAVAVRATLTGAGETKMVQFMLWNGGTQDRDGCSDTGPLPEGMTHESDGSVATATIPLASLDAVPGGELQLGTLEVRQLVRDPRPGTVMLCGTVDEAAPAGPVPLLGGSVDPPTVYHDIADDVAKIDLAFGNATDGGYVFNWTHSLTALDLHIRGDAESGEASLVIRDATSVLYDANITQFLDGQNHTAHAFRDATPGEWQLVVNLTGFIGAVSVRAGPPDQAAGGADGAEPGGGGSPAADGGDTTGNATDDAFGTGNGTGNATLDDAEDAESPGWALLPMLAALVVLAARRRK